MELDEGKKTTIIPSQEDHTRELCMVDEERWAEIRRLREETRVSISEIARRLDLDRKTVRRSLRQTTWQPYRRAAVPETRLTAHADFVRGRAPHVNDSARILYQELRASHAYTAVYETVKRWVAPLREVQLQAERALVRFETPRRILRCGRVWRGFRSSRVWRSSTSAISPRWIRSSCSR